MCVCVCWNICVLFCFSPYVWMWDGVTRCLSFLPSSFFLLDCCLSADCRANSNMQEYAQHAPQFTLWTFNVKTLALLDFVLFQSLSAWSSWNKTRLRPYYAAFHKTIEVSVLSLQRTAVKDLQFDFSDGLKKIQLRQWSTSWVFINMHCLMSSNKVYLSLWIYVNL